jgi:enoyl-CoA hydratase/carnithine racemase
MGSGEGWAEPSGVFSGGLLGLGLGLSPDFGLGLLLADRLGSGEELATILLGTPVGFGDLADWQLVKPNRDKPRMVEVKKGAIEEYFIVTNQTLGRR